MKQSDEQLINKINEAAQQVIVGSQYSHYKNPENLYKVLQLAIIKDSTEVCVIYAPQYGANIPFVRPLSNWLEEVEVDGEKVMRFTLINGV